MAGFEPNIVKRAANPASRAAPDADAPPADSNLSSIARAEARAREIRQQLPNPDAYRDKFHAPPAPEGWTYEWKRRSVYNQEDSQHIMETTVQGWTPVPLSRHPNEMPSSWTGSTIERDGQMLMERPAVLTQEARLREQRQAREAVLTKEAQLRATRDGDLGRREVQAFSKSHQSMPIPDEG